MKTYIRYSVLVFTALFCNFVHAGGSTNYGEITEMYVNGNWTMVKVQGITANPDSCPSNSYYALNPVDKNYDTLHSTLIAAQVAGKKVKFYLGGCSGQSQQYPHIVSIWLR